jgi:chaperonin cofactor prefoldin
MGILPTHWLEDRATGREAMWLFDVLSGRQELWRKVTDQRLANQQGDMLRIEQKLDEMDVRLHRMLGGQATRIDDQSIMLGDHACQLTCEKRHVDLIGAAGELTVATVKGLRSRIETLEKRSEECDRQITALLEWGRAIDAWLQGESGEQAAPTLECRDGSPL